MAEELTAKQKLFCQEYLVDLNGTQAAIRSGYSAKTAQEQSSRLLSNVMICSTIERLLQKRQKKVEVTADDILHELLILAKVDLSEAFDDLGHLRPIKEIPENVRRAISNVEVFEEFEGSGKNKVYIGQTKKIKFWDKTKALELLGKHLKLFIDQHEVTHKRSLEDLLQESNQPKESE